MLLLLSISFVCFTPSSFYFILYLLPHGAKAQTQGPPLDGQFGFMWLAIHILHLMNLYIYFVGLFSPCFGGTVTQ